MPAILTDLLDAVNEYLSDRVGLYFNQMRFADLARGLHNASAELGYEDTRACVESMLENKFSKTDLQIVVRNLTIGETYFFRDPAVFIALEEKILPKYRRANNDRPLRIWSAGCSTGEEPYSIAISLLRTVPKANREGLHLLATDINTRSLDKARTASYGHWSFRTTPEDFLQKYFDRSEELEGQQQLKPEIASMVNFGYLNLAEDQYPSLQSNTTNIDIIFCRNVLIYFTTSKCKEIASKLSACLAPGGVLVMSASDSSRFITCPPESLERLSSTMFVKTNADKTNS